LASCYLALLSDKHIILLLELPVGHSMGSFGIAPFLTAIIAAVASIAVALITQRKQETPKKEPGPRKIRREPTDWRIVVGIFNLVSAGALTLAGIYFLSQNNNGSWLIPVPLAAANLYYAHDALVKRSKAPEPPQSS
jgi:hypothetical protein